MEPARNHQKDSVEDYGVDEYPTFSSSSSLVLSTTDSTQPPSVASSATSATTSGNLLDSMPGKRNPVTEQSMVKRRRHENARQIPTRTTEGNSGYGTGAVMHLNDDRNANDDEKIQGPIHGRANNEYGHEEEEDAEGITSVVGSQTRVLQTEFRREDNDNMTPAPSAYEHLPHLDVSMQDEQEPIDRSTGQATYQADEMDELDVYEDYGNDEKAEEDTKGNADTSHAGIQAPPPPPREIVPNVSDVLLAPQHGIDYRQNSGNMKLAFMIYREREKYHGWSHKSKAEVIKEVVRQVKLQDPPGRFLKLNNSAMTQEWIEVSDEYAYMHVLHMFLRQQLPVSASGAGGGSGGPDSRHGPSGGGTFQSSSGSQGAYTDSGTSEGQRNSSNGSNGNHDNSNSNSTNHASETRTATVTTVGTVLSEPGDLCHRIKSVGGEAKTANALSSTASSSKVEVGHTAAASLVSRSQRINERNIQNTNVLKFHTKNTGAITVAVEVGACVSDPKPHWEIAGLEKPGMSMVRRSRFFQKPTSVSSKTLGATHSTRIQTRSIGESKPRDVGAAQNSFSEDTRLIQEDEALAKELNTDEFGCVHSGWMLFDDGVVEVALYNFESFYQMKRGTATFEMVQSTSAGIQGWAASVIGEGPSTGQEEATQASVAVMPEQPKTGRKRRGDEEEQLQLQIALLESVGANPKRLSYAPSDSETPSDSEDFKYESDEDSESEGFRCSSVEGGGDKEEAVVAEQEKAKESVREDQSSPRAKDVPLGVENTSVGTQTTNCILPPCEPTAVCKTGSANTELEDHKPGSRTIVRSSWQFQALMGQIKARHPKLDTSQRKLVDDVPKQELSQLQGSCKRSDDDSWSQLSNVSYSDRSDPVMIGGDPEESTSSCDKSWHRVEASAPDDWSDGELC